MPIYAYRCSSCGFQKDHLQKMSDPRLTECPECGKPDYQKMLTAAGFQLKGSGWYATDFKGGSSGAPAPAEGSTASAEKSGGDSGSKEGSSKDGPSKDGPSKDGPSKDSSSKDSSSKAGGSPTPAAAAAPAAPASGS